MKVKMLSKDGYSPKYETSGAVWLDLRATKDYEINPMECVMIETWVAVEIPEGYMIMLAPRSSTFKKHGLILVNSVWVIDNDYCGNDDTLKFQYLNLTKEKVIIEKWTRIGQAIFVKVAKHEIEMVDNLEWKSRGWFGTTGTI